MPAKVISLEKGKIWTRRITASESEGCVYVRSGEKHTSQRNGRFEGDCIALTRVDIAKLALLFPVPQEETLSRLGQMVRAAAERSDRREVAKQAAAVTMVRCPECGNEQADMGAGVNCEECNFGPMPYKRPRR